MAHMNLTAGSLMALSLLTANIARAEAEAPPGRTIAYAVTEIKWAIYETKDKTECPNGLNKVGPREAFKLRFPDDGKPRTLIETQLTEAAGVWWPMTATNDFPIPEAAGKVAYGVNLDAKTTDEDFTSPEGRPGIDNQLYRAIGCIPNYRSGASVAEFQKIFFSKHLTNRILIELTDVDSLANDADITVTTYRGRDLLVSDATGAAYVPGGTQRLDLRWGKEFIHSAKGKIVDGELITEPLEFLVPMELPHQSAAVFTLHGARLQLRLTGGLAEGVVGGYADIDTLYRARNREWSPHHLSYGQESSAAMYQSMRKLADAYPDPATGANMAISSALDVDLVQVHILRDSDLTPRQSAGDAAAAPAQSGSR